MKWEIDDCIVIKIDIPTHLQILRLRIDNINSAHVKLNICSFQDIINYHKNRGGGFEGLTPPPLNAIVKI